MADNHEHHGPIHQATWVPGLTMAVCFAFILIVAGVKILFGPG